MIMNAVSAVKYSAVYKALDCRAYVSNSVSKSLPKAFLLPMVNKGYKIANVGASAFHHMDPSNDEVLKLCSRNGEEML